MKLLCLSNGHGEDAIACRIAHALQQRPDAPELVALPLVGEGLAYRQADIPILGPVKRMPSGGFVFMDNRQLARDLRGGLLQLTLRQLKVLRSWAQSGGAILAVGDILPLLFSWWSGAPYAFIGTAKSEYYVQDEAGLLPRSSWFVDRLERWSGSVYYPWERWLMQHSRCKAVFPRDRLTTHTLQKRHIPAVALGNPMMDGLEPGHTSFTAAEHEESKPLTFVLLPGSRIPEAYANWEQILQAVISLKNEFWQRELLFIGAIAPGLELESLIEALRVQGWFPSPTAEFEHRFTQNRATLILTQTAFADALHAADMAIAMTGTGTEQFVGLGKPAIIVPGKGPQFTPAFAEAQTRLLGASVVLVDHPTKVVRQVQSLLQDPDRLQLIAENGHRRMGEPGAADRIAEFLLEQVVWSID